MQLRLAACVFPASGVLLVPAVASSDNDRCTVVDVVDVAGRPVPGASVALMGCDPWDVGVDCPGPIRVFGSWTTDARGRACGEELLESDGFLVVQRPDLSGGWCAGVAHVPWHPDIRRLQSARIVLDFPPMARVSWQGRIVSPDKRPLSGVIVRLDYLYPAGNAGCSLAPQVDVKSAADGRFALPAMPSGTAQLRIFPPPLYAQRDVEITVPGAPQDIVLEHGASWRGRVLDPDGVPIEKYAVWITTATDRLIGGTYPGSGFVLEHLDPGVAKMQITVDHLGTTKGRRTLRKDVRVDPNEVRVQDIRWPTGATIAGRVVDQAGIPVARARVEAFPKPTLTGDTLEVETDTEGRFAFRYLPPGSTWTLPRFGLDVSAGTTDVRVVWLP